MTVDGVEEPGEAEAEHCAQKEHPEHHLLLEGAMKYIFGLSMVKIPKNRNSTKPSRWVQMLPVSVWMRKMLRKQARKEGMGGRWPWSR